MKKQITFAILGIFLFCAAVQAQTTAFTYQGRLTDSNVAQQPTNGTYQMQFALFDAMNAPVGAAITVSSVQVVNGIFTVNLDFGAAAFPANVERLLEIRVFNPATAAYVPLSPRQPLSSAPFAIRALNATTADVSTNTLSVGGTPAAQIIKEGDTRLTDTRTPTAGSANYIQNQNAAAQTSTNFRIDGTGAANVFNAATQFDIGGGRVLSVAGSDNTFAGFNTGTVNSTGISNSFFGRNAGSSNTTGGNNSFVGRDAGRNNSTGATNSFFGVNAGLNNASGSENVFVGVQAGSVNITGGNNTIIGTAANVGANNLTFATAIGSGAVVSANNTVVLGRSADTVQIPGTISGSGAGLTNLNAANITTGTLGNARLGVVPIANGGTGSAAQNFVDLTTAQTIAGDKTFSNTLTGSIVNAGVQFNLGGSRVLSVGGTQNLFVGIDAGRINTTGRENAFFGVNAGQDNTEGDGNSFIGDDTGFSNTTGFLNSFVGYSAGSNNTTGSYNTVLGSNANVGAGGLSFAAAIGAGAVVSSNNTIVLGRENRLDRVVTPGGLSLRDDPHTRIFYDTVINGIQFSAVNGFRWSSANQNRVNMVLEVDGDLGIVGSYLQISDARYKTNVQTFTNALDAIRRLRGVTFNWKPELNKNPNSQIGFIAQEVEAVLPGLVSTDKEGYKSVSYSNAVPVLVEAVKEQQTQIEAQQKQINELKQIVCSLKPDAAVCQ